MRLRDRLEFSKEENAEFDFLEERLYGLEEIGFDCKNGEIIEMLFPLHQETLIRFRVGQLDDQRYSLKEIKIIDDEKIQLVLHLRYPLKSANRLGRFLVDVYDIISLKSRNVFHK